LHELEAQYNKHLAESNSFLIENERFKMYSEFAELASQIPPGFWNLARLALATVLE
jgi:hypothetical protein